MRKIRTFIHKCLIRLLGIKFAFSRLFSLKNTFRIGFLTDEFFHPDLMPFGGYGMTLKLVTDHINNNRGLLSADVLMCAGKDIPRLEIRRYHSADLVFLPRVRGASTFLQCTSMIDQRGVNVFIGVDHHPIYEYYLRNFPYLPWVVWIKAPVDKVILERIATVPLETRVSGARNTSELIMERERWAESLREMLQISHAYGRKVYFAAETDHLAETAKRQYRLDDINAFHWPKPIPLPAIKNSSFSERPSFLFLGRLDPIKRPWIYFELAKRFKNADFYVGGITHYPEVMDPIISKYTDIPNLRFLGRVDGHEKANLLDRVWAVINTSIHEGVPVSLLEGFSYGKPAIAALDSDHLTSRFGIYVGEIFGDGDNVEAADRFSAAVDRVINGQFDKQQVGWQGRQYIGNVHSFKYFESALVDALKPRSHFEYQLTG